MDEDVLAVDYIVDWANVLSALGTLIALPFAVGAYVVAQRANRQAKRQGRRTFELEVLKEMVGIAERLAQHDGNGLAKDVDAGLALFNALLVRLALLPPDEFIGTGRVLSLYGVLTLPSKRALIEREVLEAIKRRME
jgi:hypothetical protein